MEYSDNIYIIPISISVSSDSTHMSYMDFIVHAIIGEIYGAPISNKLSISDFNKLNVIDVNYECPICIETKTSGIKLDCNHIFCKECAENWLTIHKNTCPTCRKEVIF